MMYSLTGLYKRTKNIAGNIISTEEKPQDKPLDLELDMTDIVMQLSIYEKRTRQLLIDLKQLKALLDDLSLKHTDKTVSEIMEEEEHIRDYLNNLKHSVHNTKYTGGISGINKKEFRCMQRDIESLYAAKYDINVRLGNIDKTLDRVKESEVKEKKPWFKRLLSGVFGFSDNTIKKTYGYMFKFYIYTLCCFNIILANNVLLSLCLVSLENTLSTNNKIINTHNNIDVTELD